MVSDSKSTRRSRSDSYTRRPSHRARCANTGPWASRITKVDRHIGADAFEAVRQIPQPAMVVDRGVAGTAQHEAHVEIAAGLGIAPRARAEEICGRDLGVVGEDFREREIERRWRPLVLDHGDGF